MLRAWTLVLICAGGLTLESQAQSPAPGPHASAPNGRKIVTDRRHGLCLLCHGGAFEEEPFPGNIAPDLRLLVQGQTAQALRSKIVNPQAHNPQSIMPAYGIPSQAERVAARWRGQPLLSDQEIDDVVAFLMTLQVHPLQVHPPQVHPPQVHPQ